MADLTVPQGDYGYHLDFTVLLDNGKPCELTDYEVTLKVWKSGMKSSPILKGECHIDTAEYGECHYDVMEDDFNVAGDYLLEIELTQKGIKESTMNYILKVEESP